MARPLFAATLILFVALATSPLSWSQDRDTERASDLVHQALQAELAGDNQLRAELLKRALASDADCELAHWQLGRVQVDGKWIDAAEYQKLIAIDKNFQRYQEMRFDGPKPVGDHVAMARWCRKRNMDIEAKYHWYQVIQLQPNHAEALDGLDARWVNGQLLTHGEAIDLRRSRSAANHARRVWMPRFRRWVKSLTDPGIPEQKQTALRQLDELIDAEVIPALEATMLGEDEDLELVAIRTLGNIADFEATKSLVRMSVLSDFESVRAAAIEQLQDRPLHDFAPFLLIGLETPLQSWFEIEYGPDGDVYYRHEVTRVRPESQERTVLEGQFDQVDGRNGVETVVAGARAGISYIPATPNDRVARSKERLASANAERYAKIAYQLERDVAKANADNLKLNERIHAVLEQTAPVQETQLGESPEQWWGWWQDYNEVYVSDEKQIYERNWNEYSSYTYTPRVIRTASCFARGTKVWAKQGLVPIEKIQSGDLVLSQDPETGELDFRPVLGTTWRPPCRQVRLRINGQTIDATLGHPFWLTGTGWRMAKFLEPRSLVHTLRGSHRVEQVQPLPEEEAFNLIVGDFNSYFVGEQGILVHDNTYRRPTLAVLPGMFY